MLGQTKNRRDGACAGSGCSVEELPARRIEFSQAGLFQQGFYFLRFFQPEDFDFHFKNSFHKAVDVV